LGLGAVTGFLVVPGVIGAGVVGFLVVPGVGVRRGREFSPAGSSRNPLRRPATHFSWRGGWRLSAGLVWGASGCALRPLTPGFPDPHRRTPTPRRPVAKETGIQKPTPCGVSLWPTLAACAWWFAPAKAQAGPGTPGEALRPGVAG